MKKIIYIFIAVLLIASTAKAQYVNIPDSNFRNALKVLYPTCFNGAGMMDTTCSGVVNATNLNVGGKAIKSLDGIQYFKNITVLYCHADNLTSLPILPNSILNLYCYNNQLTSISQLPNALITLDCSYNLLTSLPALPNTLTDLTCNNNHLSSLPTLPNVLTFLWGHTNQLTSLPVLPNSLTRMACNNNLLTVLPALPNSLTQLICGSNLLTSIPVLPNSLTFMDCSINKITSLPVSLNSLKTLYCDSNKLISLPTLPNTLTDLSCGHNKLFNLPLLPNSLTSLVCDYNELSNLPALPGFLSFLYCRNNKLNVLPSLPNGLTRLICDNNQINSLPIFPNGLTQLTFNNNLLNSLPTLPNTLTTLGCKNNQLTSLPALPSNLVELTCGDLNLHCLPKLPISLKYLFIDALQVHCLPNIPMGCRVNNQLNSSYPICNAVNNPTHCQCYPQISGKVFNDNNSNTIKDGNDNYRGRIKVQLSNGDYGFTNDSGYYRLAADSIGAYTLTVKTPNLYNAFPANIINYNFNSYDTLVASSIALQPIITKDSLDIKICSHSSFARQSRRFPYSIIFENVGTTILNPIISFNYDASKLDYDSSDASVTNTGNSLSLNINNFVPGQQNKFIVYFTVKTNAVVNDTLRANAAITGGSATAIDNVYNIIRSSFDPNDKTATPELTTAELVNGKYIDYTIRFQNTGNDTAFNVVLADSLSSKLQSNSLEMVASSHNCKATVKAGIAYFEFLNINLVDSVHNEKGSHGFVRFKIKPKVTLIAGDSINNKASIYFDYNSAVVTNTATTKIKNPIIVPLKLLSFDGNALENGNNLLYWNTANEINTQSFIIQQSMDGRVFASVGEVKAKGKVNNSYNFNALLATPYSLLPTLYYRLMIKDNDGSFSFSKIIVIKSETRNTKLEILSNPVKNELVLSSISNSLINTEASLINSNGIVVKRFVMNGSNQSINVSSLSNGIYYLRTVEGSRKLIINN